MGKLIDLAGKKFATVVFLTIGTGVPGILTIAIFNRVLFCEIDTVKLILLSFAIGIPTVAVLFEVMINSLPGINMLGETETALNFACLENIIIFSVALLIKIFIKGLSLNHFVIILLGIEVLAIFYWFLFQKNIVKKGIYSKTNE
ncbi:hypothetical protein [Parablautia intestinalis]|uniref:hypothetical protein n=1 Tax=Parablautia intestinalis TaxID=2320100 RepID=UPI00256F18C2|nr:hypothetical protein [Parablautia intestinalis]